MAQQNARPSARFDYAYNEFSMEEPTGRHRAINRRNQRPIQTTSVIHGTVPNASSHRTDSSITRDIKSGIGKNKSLQSVTIKVTTERGIVYLLGLATHAEADAASEIASTTSDVKKVVRVFEYID